MCVRKNWSLLCHNVFEMLDCDQNINPTDHAVNYEFTISSYSALNVIIDSAMRAYAILFVQQSYFDTSTGGRG